MPCSETAAVGLVVALWDELRPIARHLRLRGRVGRVLRGNVGGVPLVVRLSGVGRDRAAAAARLLLTQHGCGSLLTAGYGGALDPTLAVADVLVASAVQRDEAPPVVSSADWASAVGGPTGLVWTTSRLLADPAAKAAAHAASGAAVVDLETAAVAAVASEQGVPWLGLRAVSDTANEALPVFVTRHFDEQRGELRLYAMFAWLLLHPRQWPVVADYARRQQRMGRALALAVATAVERRR
ncbi:MAG: hypothetical protein IT204_16145 [Fimbriimonadaceae bacterium]|nr:hypothetical protein [Fimbriimonadaceae bacterium]